MRGALPEGSFAEREAAALILLDEACKNDSHRAVDEHHSCQRRIARRRITTLPLAGKGLSCRGCKPLKLEPLQHFAR